MEYVIKNLKGEYLCDDIHEYVFDDIDVDHAARFDTYDAAYKISLNYEDAFPRAADTDLIDQANIHLKLAKDEGKIEVQDGVYLWTAEAIQNEHEDWPEEDQWIGFDFSIAPFWVSNDDRLPPDLVRDAVDLVDLLMEG